MAEPTDDVVYAPPGDARAADPEHAPAPKDLRGACPALDALDAPDEGGPPPDPPPQRSLASRVAITLGAAVAAVLLEKIPLPGIDALALEQATGSGFPAAFSVGALGLTPIVGAYVFVELAALAVPRWRRLRHNGPEGRRKLHFAAAIVAILFALFQGYGVARSVISSDFGGSYGPLPLLVTLSAGTFALWGIAGLVSRRGLGNGLLWLGAVGFVHVAIRKLAGLEPPPFRMSHAGSDGASLPRTLLAAALVILATVLVLRRPEAQPPPAPGDAASPAPLRLGAPAPASGIAPLTFGAALAALPMTLASFGIPMPSPPSGSGGLLDLLIVVVPAAICVPVFAYWFHLPSRSGALLARAGIAVPSPDRERERFAAGMVWPAMLPATVYVVTLVLAMTAGAPPNVAALTLAVAWAMDAVADHRAREAHPGLVSVWTDERPYAAEIAREVLARRGIALHASGLSQRRLLQFGAGYAPIDLCVPAEHAARARRYLAAALPDPAPERAEDFIETPVEKKKKKRKDGAAKKPGARELLAAAPASPERRFTLSILTVAAAALVLTVIAMVPASSLRALPTAEELEARSKLLHLAMVDDDVDPLQAFAESPDLPRGVRMEKENAPFGLGRTQIRTYAVGVLGEGEDLDAVAARVRPWLDSVTVPAGRRLLLGEHTQWDDDTRRQEIAGLRTYLVHSEPILTGADVVDAQARSDVSRGGDGSWTVMVELTPDGGERFRQATAANVKRRLAIVVEGRVMSAPVIQTEIAGGHVVITMGSVDPPTQKANAERLARSLGGR